MGCNNSTSADDDSYMQSNSVHVTTFRRIKTLEQMLRLNVTPVSRLMDLSSTVRGVSKIMLTGDSRFQNTTLYYYPLLKRIFITTLVHRNALGQFPIRPDNEVVQLYAVFDNISMTTMGDNYVIGQGLITNYPYRVYDNEFTIHLNPREQPITPSPESFSLRVTSSHVTLGQLCGLSFVLSDFPSPEPIPTPI